MAATTIKANELPEDTFTFIMSALTTGLAIAGTLIATVVVCIAYCMASSYVGRPWAMMLLTYMPQPPQEAAFQSSEEAKRQRIKLEGLLGGIVGFLMFLAAVAIESIRFELEAQKGGGHQWTIWNAAILFIKAGIEGMIALGVTSGVIRLARLG